MNTASLIGYAVPGFWLAQLALLVLAIRTGWFPIQGMTDARVEHAGLALVLDVGHHLVLPAVVLAVSEIAPVTRVTTTGLIQEIGRDYVRTAQAKGVSERRTIFFHALPNALLPVVTPHRHPSRSALHLCRGHRDGVQLAGAGDPPARRLAISRSTGVARPGAVGVGLGRRGQPPHRPGLRMDRSEDPPWLNRPSSTSVEWPPPGASCGVPPRRQRVWSGPV